VTDSEFGEMNLIMCRNVLIYFTGKLQKKVLSLFTESLCDGGVLCLGTKESLISLDNPDLYTALNTDMKVYKKRYVV